MSDKTAEMANLRKRLLFGIEEEEENIDHYTVKDLLLQKGIDVDSINVESVKQAYKLTIAVLEILDDKRFFHNTKLEIYAEGCSINYSRTVMEMVEFGNSYGRFVEGGEKEDGIRRHLSLALYNILEGYATSGAQNTYDIFELLELKTSPTLYFLRVFLHEYGHYRESYIVDREGLKLSAHEKKVYYNNEYPFERLYDKGLYPLSHSSENYADYFCFTYILLVLQKLKEKDPNLVTCLDKYARKGR